MHPLLLFTLFFLPGIKTSYLRSPDSNVVGVNGLDSAVKSDSVDTAVGEPRLVHDKVVGGVKARQKSLWDRHRALELERRRSDQELLSGGRSVTSGRGDIRHLQSHRGHQYAATPSPEFYRREVKDNHHDEKRYYKKKWNPKFQVGKDEKSVHFKSFKKNKPHKERLVLHGRRNEDGKRFGKNSRKEADSSEEKREKYVNDHLRKSRSVERRLRSERVRRKADSTDSDESFHGGEYEESVEDDDKSEGSNENLEKLIIAQLLEGATVQDGGSHPYRDFINVHIPKRKEASPKMLPVVEELITKTKAYISCDSGANSLGCQMKKPSEETQDLNQVQEEQFRHRYDSVMDSARPMDDKDSSEIDEEAWLRALEDEIMNSGIDVQFHH